MRTWRHLPVGARRALWAGGVLLVLAGVVGMHGLSTHGLGAVTPTAPGAHAVHAMESASTSVALAVGAPDHGGAEMSGVGLCFAVLMASLLALILRHRRQQATPLWFATPMPGPVAVRRARSPDPPCLFALSIQRC